MAEWSEKIPDSNGDDANTPLFDVPIFMKIIIYWTSTTIYKINFLLHNIFFIFIFCFFFSRIIIFFLSVILFCLDTRFCFDVCIFILLFYFIHSFILLCIWFLSDIGCFIIIIISIIIVIIVIIFNWFMMITLIILIHFFSLFVVTADEWTTNLCNVYHIYRYSIHFSGSFQKKDPNKKNQK